MKNTKKTNSWAMGALSHSLIVLISILIGFQWTAQASNIKVSKEEYSAKKSIGAAKKEIINKVIDFASRENIIKLIGVDKYQRNQKAIQSKIIANSGKFMPLIKTGSIQTTFDNQYKMEVHLTISFENLKSMLLDEGLLYDQEGLPNIMPFIVFKDRVHGGEIFWWSGESLRSEKFLLRMGQQSDQVLSSNLSARGFFSERPYISASIKKRRISDQVPSEFRKQRLSDGDYLILGDRLKTPLALKGKVVLEENPIEAGSFAIKLNWQVMYAKNSRVVAEVSKREVTEVGSFEEVVGKKIKSLFSSASKHLTEQLYTSWKNGTLGSSLFRVVLRGNLDYKSIEKLKEKLLREAKHIKRVRERLLAPQEVSFDVDAIANANQLIDIIQRVNLDQWSLKSSRIGNEVGGQRLEFDLYPKRRF